MSVASSKQQPVREGGEGRGGAAQAGWDEYPTGEVMACGRGVQQRVATGGIWVQGCVTGRTPRVREAERARMERAPGLRTVLGGNQSPGGTCKAPVRWCSNRWRDAGTALTCDFAAS